MGEAEEYYSIQGVADKLHVNERTIRRLIIARQLSATVIGKIYRISESQLVEYLTKNTIQPKDKE